MTMKAAIGLMQLQARSPDCQQNTRGWERQEGPPTASERAWRWPYLGGGLRASGTMRQWVSVVLSTVPSPFVVVC